MSIGIGRGSYDGGGSYGLLEPQDGKAVVAHKGDVVAVGRELGVVTRGCSGKANLDTRAVMQIEEPEPAVGVEEQVG